MNYLNQEVLKALSDEQVALTQKELATYKAVCNNLDSYSQVAKTKKDVKGGLRFSVIHSGQSHFLILPGQANWKTKGKDVVTKKAIDLMSGEKLFVKIRRPQFPLQDKHVQTSLREAANHQRMNLPTQHCVRFNLDVGSKAYLFQKFQGEESFQSIMADPTGSPQKLMNILLASGQALQKLHRSGYLHTDFKPQNVVFNRSNHKLTLVDLEYLISIEEGAAGVKSLTGTLPFQHPDWLRKNMRNVHLGQSVKYTTREDVFAYLVTAESCIGRAHRNADPSFRESLSLAWQQVRAWKALPYEQLPNIDKVLSILKEHLLANNPENNRRKQGLKI